MNKPKISEEHYGVRKKSGEKPFHKEGFQNSEWILLDYSNLIIHIFLEDKRTFLDIEGLWADGKITEIEHNEFPTLNTN